MNIMEVVSKQARLYPNNPAFIETGPVSKIRSAVTWAQFDERTDRLANSLLARGVHNGEKIFVLGKNSIKWLEAYLSVMKTGAWVVPLNFRFTDQDILFCADTANPIAFIHDSEFAERIEALRPRLPSVQIYVTLGKQGFPGVETTENLINKGPADPVRISLTEDDECALYFTSGTTGAPKPVLIQHKSVMCTAVTEAVNHYLTPDDRFLMMAPMYHVAIGHMFGVMLAGGCSVLLTEQVSPEYIVDTIEKEQCTVVFLLVPWAMDLLQAFDTKAIRVEERNLSSWRLTHMGAQPIPAALIKRIKEYFPGMQYDTNYGLSESMGPGVIHLGIENERKVGAMGKASLLWDARIVNDEDQDVPRGEVGEVILKGAGVMKEYYKNSEMTGRTIKNGWLHTGDLGRCDEEGFIYLVDRKKDLIISGGENIYPVEVEEVILKHPNVFDVALIGIPDDRMGEVTCAIIDPKPGILLTEEEIREYCETQLPRYKRPRRIVFDKVPRSPTGKIEKPKLREKYVVWL